MKYFKHYTDAHEGRSLMTLFEQFGHAGPNCYWILLELCAKKIEKNSRDSVLESDCHFAFHERLLREKFRLSSTKVQLWFNLASTLVLLSFEKVGNEFKISMPKLLEILEHRPQNRAESARIRAQDKDKIREDNIIEAKASSGVGKKPSARRQLEHVEFSNSDELRQNLGDEWMNRQREIYPDAEYCERELKKAFGYYQDNPVKRPRTVPGWKRTLTLWFDRGWPRYVAQKPSSKQVVIDWDALKRKYESGGAK